MKRSLTIFVLALAFVLGACAVKTQKTRIRDARLGIAIAGVGLEAADNAAVDYFEEFPAEDTEKYCQGEITLAIMETVRTSLVGAAESIKAWETLLAVYLTKKEAGGETDADWTAVLDADAAWMDVAGDMLGVVRLVIDYLHLAGVKVPEAIRYAYNFVAAFLDRPTITEPEINWGQITNGVCADYLSGGE